MTKPAPGRTWQLLFGALLAVGILGIVAIALIYPGRPRTLLTVAGPYVLLLVSLVGLFGLALTSFGRSKDSGKN